MLYFALLAVAFMLLVAAASVRRTRPAPPVWRSVLVHPHSSLNHLYALDWDAQQFMDAGAHLRARGRMDEAHRFEDFARIRMLEERLEVERFAQMRDRKASVRALARVRAA